MLIIIKAKDIENIIGLKEDISARLEGVAEIERIDVCDNEGMVIPRLTINWKEKMK